MAAQGRHEQAVEAWSAALADDPDDPEAFLVGRMHASARPLGERPADLQRAADSPPTAPRSSPG